MHHDLVLAGPVVTLRPLGTADTAYFSITDADWPGVRDGLRGRVGS